MENNLIDAKDWQSFSIQWKMMELLKNLVYKNCYRVKHFKYIKKQTANTHAHTHTKTANITHTDDNETTG